MVAFLRYGSKVDAFVPDKTDGYADVNRYMVLMQLITV